MNLFNTRIAPDAVDRIRPVLESSFLSEGKTVEQFEQTLSQELGLRNPVAVNSGTSALHLAITAFRPERGNEIILPAQTFVATALAILYAGAAPVFADIDPRTGNISTDSIKVKITKKTIGIIGVDWAGYPCDLKEIQKIADESGFFVIEDAAQALGATYLGNPVGLGNVDVTCFSFQATKHLTTGDGGCICSNAELSKYYRKYRWFGIDRNSHLPNELGERQYALFHIGYKYHLNDYAAALGLANLVGLKERLAKRINNAKLYEANLANVAGLSLMRYAPDRQSAYWAFPILVERRKQFVRKMREREIPVSVIHQRIDKHPLFDGICRDLVGQMEFDERQIHLPVHDGLTDDDMGIVIKTIQEGW